jgi:hypothetical protein
MSENTGDAIQETLNGISTSEVPQTYTLVAVTVHKDTTERELEPTSCTCTTSLHIGCADITRGHEHGDIEGFDPEGFFMLEEARKARMPWILRTVWASPYGPGS